MTDLLTATQDAVFAAVSAGVTAAPVVVNVPENWQPPLVVIGSIEATNIGGKDGGLEQHAITLHYVYRGGQRRLLYAMMHEGRSALEAADLSAPGAEFGDAVWDSSSDQVAEDGVTYQGEQTFNIIVQPDE